MLKVSKFLQFQRNIFFGILAVAVAATLLVVVPQTTRTAGASVEDLPSDTGFTCSSEGRGGFPYQMMWANSTKQSKNLFNGNGAVPSEVTALNINPESHIHLQLARYNAATEKYDVVGTWAPALNGGLKNDNGETLLSANTFLKNNFEQVNGLAMDPYGNAYVAIQPVDGKGSAYYVQLIPPAEGELGTMRAIAELAGNPTNINAATYYETALLGLPKVVMGGNFFKSAPYNVLLYRAEGAAVPLVQKEETRTGNDRGGPKDFSWIREGISWTGSYSPGAGQSDVNGTQIYDLIALHPDSSGTTGTVFLGQAAGPSTAKISGVSIPAEAEAKKDTFGASYNFKLGDDKTYIYFTANKSGQMIQVELPDPNSDGNITITGGNSFDVTHVGKTAATSENDGAGCPNDPPPRLGSLVASTWPPDCNLADPDGKGSTFPISIFNSEDNPQNVFITVKVNNVVVTGGQYFSSGSAYNPTLDGTHKMSVPGKKNGSQGELILTVDIEKDQTWSVEVKNPNDGNKILELIPSGGTLNTAACDGDFSEETIFNANHTVGTCNSVGDKYEIGVAINNSMSNVDASFRAIVDGFTQSFITTIPHGTDSPENDSIKNITLDVSPNDQIVLEIGEKGEVPTATTYYATDCVVIEEASIDPFPCSSPDVNGQIQVRLNEDSTAYAVVVLDPSAGGFNTLWEMPFTWTSSDGNAANNYEYLNGTAIHPTTDEAYALLRFEDDRSYLVRFDDEKFEYVFKLPNYGTAGGWSNNGTFDDDGNFYYWTSGGVVAKITAAQINAQANLNHWDITDANIPTLTPSLGASSMRGADLIAVTDDFGSGEKTYLIGIQSVSGGAGGVYVYDVAGNIITQFASFGFSDGKPMPDEGYGAAYKVTDNNGAPGVFFSSNGGDTGTVVTLNLDSIDITDNSQKVTFSKAGGLPATNQNDGMGCAVSILSVPLEFGDVYGYMWVDFNKDGNRTAVEAGTEPHVTGYDVTFTNVTPYLDSAGNVVHLPGAMRFEDHAVMGGTNDTNYKWEANLPCKDNSGGIITWQAEFDYSDATWPTGFTPAGYTVQNNPDSVNTAVLDSDTEISAAVNSMSSPFTVSCDSSVHRADAGVVGDYVFTPTATIDIDCAAGTIVVNLDNSASDIDSNFVVGVYTVDSLGTVTQITAESASQVVAAGVGPTAYATGITIPAADTLLYLVIEGQGSLNSVVNSTDYSEVVLNQSANDAINVLCVQVQAETDCAGDGVSVVLDNTESNQIANFTITPIMNGVNQTSITQAVPAAGTVTLTNADLNIPEDSTWGIQWEVAGATAGSFGPYRIPESATDDMTLDCVEPVFAPTISGTIACASNDAVTVTFTVDNSNSTLTTNNSDPVTDGNTVQITSVAGGVDVFNLNRTNVVPGATYTETLTLAENEPIAISVYSLNDVFGAALVFPVTTCPDFSPSTSMTFACGVDNDAFVSFTVNNSDSEVDVRYKLVAIDFEKNETTVIDWETLPAGFDKEVFITETGEKRMEYEVRIKSLHADQSGWSAVTESVYTDCEGEPTTFDPTVTLVAQCGADPKIVELTLDNSRSDFHASFQVDVFDGSTTSAAKLDALSTTQEVGEGSLDAYRIDIPVPDPGKMISVEILATALSTGGKSITASIVIESTMAISCPYELNFGLTTAPNCGSESINMVLNNEKSGWNALATLVLFIDGEPSNTKEVLIDAGEQKAVNFQVSNGQEWYVAWSLSVSGTTYYSAETEPRVFAPSPASSCPEMPLPTG
ncbi:MAG TPA: hypothetical protein EYG34_07095 [Acidimicrobiia bacterium]|jgi:hypothetical protein|nr:hypothetical protein [Acidimicrobiia bacterium]HIL46863.1 hypothetical protein [Acidimicrobiia bacterium]